MYYTGLKYTCVELSVNTRSTCRSGMLCGSEKIRRVFIYAMLCSLSFIIIFVIFVRSCVCVCVCSFVRVCVCVFVVSIFRLPPTRPRPLPAVVGFLTISKYGDFAATGLHVVGDDVAMWV